MNSENHIECRGCRREVAISSTFCPNCGLKLQKDISPEPDNGAAKISPPPPLIAVTKTRQSQQDAQPWWTPLRTAAKATSYYLVCLFLLNRACTLVARQSHQTLQSQSDTYDFLSAMLGLFGLLFVVTWGVALTAVLIRLVRGR